MSLGLGPLRVGAGFRLRRGEEQQVGDVGAAAAGCSLLGQASVSTPTQRLKDRKDQVLLGLRFVGRCVYREAGEDVSELLPQACHVGEAPVCLGRADAFAEKVLGEELSEIQ